MRHIVAVVAVDVVAVANEESRRGGKLFCFDDIVISFVAGDEVC